MGERKEGLKEASKQEKKGGKRSKEPKQEIPDMASEGQTAKLLIEKDRLAEASKSYQCVIQADVHLQTTS